VTFAPMQCERTPAIDQLFRQFSSNETTKIAAIGGGCGVATEAVAEISHYWQVPMVRCNIIHVQNSCNAQEIQHHCTVVVCKNPFFVTFTDQLSKWQFYTEKYKSIQSVLPSKVIMNT